jgi:putative Ca2+/H+ antiporter (TMEM165/GDT1 family)
MRELALYVAAGLAYIALGLVVPELLFSWLEGAAFLLIAVWLLPALVNRLR